MNALFQQNVLLSSYSTFGIGGPARLFAQAKTIHEMQQSIEYCLKNKIPYFILGKGSNSLFDDRGYDGAVILNKIDFIETDSKGLFHVGAGYNFSLLGSQTARQAWSGLEFASGIPGTVGGAIFMNAGANGAETFQTLISVDFLKENGELCTYSKDKLEFGYRYSSFQKMKGVILGGSFGLQPSEQARTKQLEIIAYRKKTQPLSERSAGCVFRNPVCNYAGALIEQCGLKGVSVGDAMVSSVHANFIVNTGQARASEVLGLISLIKSKVKEKTGILLESEIRLIPYNALYE